MRIIKAATFKKINEDGRLENAHEIKIGEIYNVIDEGEIEQMYCYLVEYKNPETILLVNKNWCEII